ncbi:unnamed protein product [Trichogramma brassicae]|uniref:Trifunctional purine biosynthetic protein adenosine-3 n=1 Tax=Trichogramma brassicae TaxID=86971 RepID=A0A6H5IVP3_9HYME|nr:unnamed protein product [Trichogramma brassicae]
MTLNCSILIIGSGGREHAICWKLAQSDLVTTEWCIQNKINMVVIGPENFLHQGLADELSKFNIPCFGPSKLAAKIETDKCWSKAFMDRHDIPTASWKSFSDAVEAKNFVKESSSNSLVIKASGLAAGKGVVVAKSKDEAYRAIEEILEDKKFGAAGNMIIIEEVLEGEEVSALAFTDGKTVVMMTPAQDHKRIFNNDQGPNTGGMGAYCPCSFLTKEDNEFVINNILKKTVDGMRTEGIPFVGVLYAGLMMTQNGPKVLEFNCRFGDPETQVILPLLQSDLYVIMKSCCEGNLKESYVSWKNNIFSTGVILASKGYPEYSSKGQVIEGIEEILCRDDHYVFHSGTSISESQQILTNGKLSEAKFYNCSLICELNFDFLSSILEYGTMTYKTSGVDIQAGDTFVTNIKPAVSTTMRSGVIGNIGGFGSIFDINALGFQSPLLVSGTDGVGTKLKIALEYKKHDTVGIDLVAMCVNDVLAQGAEPLYFLDYFACSKLEIDVAEKVGGETAEMPDMYSAGEYDLAGFAVGAVEKTELLPRINSMKNGVILYIVIFCKIILDWTFYNFTIFIGSCDKVRVENFETQIDHDMRKYVSPIMKHLTSLKKVGVLISGSGTNLQALIDATKNVTYQMGAEIVLVISNKPGVKGLDRAYNAGIKTKVIKHVDYKDREAFDKAMDAELVQQGVDIICLAGFMRILSPWFVKKWRGAIINIHPSLLPSFKGANAHEEVLKYGARVSGCTVHFVNEDIDSGAIIEQEAVPVMPTDTKFTLEERIKKAEHKVFPKALKLLATNQIKLKDDNTIEWLNF